MEKHTSRLRCRRTFAVVCDMLLAWLCISKKTRALRKRMIAVACNEHVIILQLIIVAGSRAIMLKQLLCTHHNENRELNIGEENRAGRVVPQPRVELRQEEQTAAVVKGRQRNRRACKVA